MTKCTVSCLTWYINILQVCQNGKNGLLFNIIFKRRLTNEALMTFLPSLLLITISYATSFFCLPNFFNTAITVNLTVMLTTTTLLISVNKKLATTGYIKWLEAWLIFAQFFPFVQVLLITASLIKPKWKCYLKKTSLKWNQARSIFGLMSNTS